MHQNERPPQVSLKTNLRGAAQKGYREEQRSNSNETEGRSQSNFTAV